MLKSSYIKQYMGRCLLAGGLVLLLSAGLLALQQAHTNHQANVAAQKAVDRANRGLPSPAPATIKPSASSVANYMVPASHPRYLLIPKLHVKARVIAVGVTKNNAIGTPSNVYDTAWYTGSNLPGQPGATLIDGHVSSWTTHGVFYNLKTLQPGDSLQIQLGNGTLISYSVVRKQIYSDTNVDVGSLLAPVTAGKPGLNLITCTGDVIKGSNEFNQRVVVYASQN